MFSLLRVNPTLKTVHAPRNTLNAAERNLYAPISRRDILSSQLLKVSDHYSNLQDELSILQTTALSTRIFLYMSYYSGVMRENKQIYADLEKLSLDYERIRLASLSPAEKEQLEEYFPIWTYLMYVDSRWGSLSNAFSEKLQGMFYRD